MAKFMSVPLQSGSGWVNTPLVTTAPTSNTDTRVEPTIASTVKPAITSSVIGKYIIIDEWLQMHEMFSRLPNNVEYFPPEKEKFWFA